MPAKAGILWNQANQKQIVPVLVEAESMPRTGLGSP
jgi:hypothetical protein